MSYLNTLENDWRADKITRDQFVELKRVYNLATPEEKKALEEVRAMGISKFLSLKGWTMGKSTTQRLY